MTTVGGESPLDLQALLATLESKSSTSEQVLEAYTILTNHLKEAELSIFEHDIVEQGKRLVTVSRKHAVGKGGVKDVVAKKALLVLGYCLKDKDIISCIPALEAAEVLALVTEIIAESKEKTTCSHALWCLSRQNFGSDVISAELPSLLKAIIKAASVWWGTSAIVEYEGIAVITRLGDQCPQLMGKNCGEWGPLLLRLLVSASPKVRALALDQTHKWMATIAGNKECLKASISALRKVIEPELKKIFKNGQESYALKVCTLLLRILQQELNNTVINSLLSILELAFRSTSMDLRTQAFRSWEVLINIFAENNCLTEPKMVDLVMRVFKTRNTATEALAMVKLGTWWHYVQCLGPRVWPLFDQVLRPLLLFCLGTSHRDSSAGGSTPSTPNAPSRRNRNDYVPLAINSGPGLATSRYGVSSSEAVNSLPAFPKVQLCGLEILAHLLRDPNRPASPSIKFTMERLETDYTISVGVFLKHAPTLITAVFDFTKAVASTCSEALLIYVWQCVTSHMRSALDSQRSERHEALTSFLGHFQVLVLSQILPQRLTMKLFQFVCSFPARVLSSTAFSIKSAAVKGCPAQFLCEVLLTPTLLKERDCQESFMTVFSTLVSCGTSHATGMLEFCQCVGDLLDRNAQILSSTEVLWRMWSIVAQTLQEHISKTNEVNQGDSLEYNFDCMYKAILLPVTHRLGARVAQAVHKTAMKTWSDLYHTFARLSAMVSNAEANVVLEEVSHKIINTVKADSYSKDAETLGYLLELCQVMVDTIDFSSLTSANPFMMGISSSSSKKSRHRPKMLGNLHSFVTLLAQLADRLLLPVLGDGSDSSAVSKSEAESGTNLAPACSHLIDTVSALVTHLNVSSLISHLMEILASPLAAVFTISSKKTSAKLHTPTGLLKVDRLWQEVCSMMQSHYKGPYDSDLLSQMAPLLQATFQHSRRSIKMQSVQLWNATFGRSSSLSYPAELQPVLSKVKEKTQLSLPGWVNMDVAVIEETPVSQMSQMDSQAPDPVVPGMPSPVRPRGSFLHKDVSPKPSLSPVKRLQPGSENKIFGSGVRKKLHVDFMSDKDFVVIKDAPKKRRVLTEHQKEIMKEKRVLPVMYNNLDASQDASLMSHFSTSDTQQEGIKRRTKNKVSLPAFSSTTDVIVINSSQSQDLLNPEPRPANEKTKSDEFPALRRSSRRRSVRFEDAVTTEQESKDSENAASAASKSQPTASVFHATPVLDTVDRLSLSKSSSEDTTQKSEEQGKSLSLPLPQPNQMTAVSERLVDTLSSRETSQSVKSLSSESSGEEKCAKSREENDPFFRPFKSLSQMLPRTRSMGGEKNSDSSSEGSVLLLTRKTRSQDEGFSSKSMEESHKENGEKSGSPPSLFTGLDRWLKKPLAADEPEEAEKLSKETESFQKISSLRSDTTLVEETQSPKKLAKEAAPNMSIQETPTKASSASTSLLDRPVVSVSSIATALHEKMDVEENSADHLSAAIRSKQPVLQLEQLSADLLDKPHVLPPPSPLHLDVGALAEKSVTLEPPMFFDDVASQGFSPEVEEDSTSPLLKSSKAGVVMQNEVMVVEDSISQSHQNSTNLDHQTLFGFSELLQNENEDGVSNSCVSEKAPEGKENDKDADEEMSENLFASTEASVTEEYNPQLTATLRATPPQHRKSHSEASQADSQKSATSSSNSENSPNSSQHSEPDASFDPTRESTLSESSEHTKRRKQRTPKKIADPQLLRRTPRRKKDKKSVCACCKDGSSSHHQDSSPKSKKRGKRQHGKDSPPSRSEVKSPVRKKAKKSHSQTAGGSLTEEQTETAQGFIGKKTAAELTDEVEKKQVDLSPQDIGEKTPEMKTSSTPLRHSTTKRKMEAARQRSASMSLEASLNKLTEADSDLEEPLSGLVSAARINKVEVSLCEGIHKSSDDELLSIKDSQKTKPFRKLREKSDPGSKVAKDSFKNGVAKDTSPVKTLLKPSASRLKLKKLAKQKEIKTVRSPPKLRLRKRKVEDVLSPDRSGSQLLNQPGGESRSDPPSGGDFERTRSAAVVGDCKVSSDSEIITDSTPVEQSIPKSEKTLKKQTNQPNKSKTLASSDEPGTSSGRVRTKSVPQENRRMRYNLFFRRLLHRKRCRRSRHAPLYINYKNPRRSQRIKAASAKTANGETSMEVAEARVEEANTEVSQGGIEDTAEIEQYESHELSADIVSESKLDTELKNTEPQSTEFSDKSGAADIETDLQQITNQVISDMDEANEGENKDSTADSIETDVVSVPETEDSTSECVSVGESVVNVEPDSVADREIGAEGSEDMFEHSPEDSTPHSVEPETKAKEECLAQVEVSSGSVCTEQELPEEETLASPQMNSDEPLELPCAEKEVSTDSICTSQETGSVSGGAADVCSVDSASEHSVDEQSQLDVEDGAEQMTAEDMLTEDSAEHLFPHNQAGLESQEEEISLSAIFASDTTKQGSEELQNSSLSGEMAVSEDMNAIENSGLCATETDVLPEDSAVTAMDQSAEVVEEFCSDEKCHRAVQTSPEPQKARKLTKQQILDLISESDVSPAEIIVALQSKSTRPRRLFSSPKSSSRHGYKTLGGRGLKMLQQSMLVQKQQQFGGYLTKSADSQSQDENDSLAGNSAATAASPCISLAAAAASPSASPVGSILKRRDPLVSQETGGLSDPSQTPTPSKKRRVSFANPVVSGESPAHEAILNKNPQNYYTRPGSQKTSIASAQTTEDVAASNPGTSASEEPTSQTETPVEQTQNSYLSTQESQLNSTDPIFPDLVDCDKPVDIILPQLTSSAWSRGLCQLLKGLKVNTIGNMAAMSEVDVQNLPVVAPKVQNVKKALKNFHTQHYAKNLKKSEPATAQLTCQQRSGSKVPNDEQEPEELSSPAGAEGGAKVSL